MRIRNPYKGKTRGEIITYTVASVIMGLFAFSYVLAFGWAVLAGANTHQGIVLHPFEWPEKWQWVNYIDVMELLEVRGVDFWGMIINTLILVIIMPVLGIAGTMVLSYACAKYTFPGKNFLLALNIVIMTLPIYGTTGAAYRMYSDLGFIDSPTLIITGIGNFGGNFLYFLSCFKGISNTYGEAARIDGAGHMKIMLKINFPMAAGTTSALWILALIARWNDSGTSLLYWPNMPTLATGIYLFNLEMMYRVRMDILMAATVISAIPPMIVFAIAHKKILSIVTFGGIKG